MPEQLEKTRGLGLAEIAAVRQLDARCFARPWPDGAWLDELRASEGDGQGPWCGGVFAGGRLVGALAGRRIADECELRRIAVDPACRRQGAGGDLLGWLVRRAREAGLTSIHLEVGERNAAARALYARHAFVPVGRRSGYYPGSGAELSQDAVLMRRELP